jgi:hypothetical protein
VSFTYWLQYIAAFLIVIGVLSIACGLREWWLWRREKQK